MKRKDRTASTPASNNMFPPGFFRSCDSAFIVEDGGNEGLIYLSVAVPEESDGVNLGLAIGLPVAFVLLLIVLVFLWQDAKRKQNDTVRTKGLERVDETMNPSCSF